MKDNSNYIGQGERLVISDNFIHNERGYSRREEIETYSSRIASDLGKRVEISANNITPTQRSYGQAMPTEPRLSIGAIKALQREADRPVTDEDLRRKRDLEKRSNKKPDPLSLIGQALEARATKVLSWNPLVTHFQYSELTPDELGKQEKERVMQLLKDSGVGESLNDDESIVLERTEEALGNFGNSTFIWVTDIALQKDGLHQFGRIGIAGQGNFTTTTEKAIPVKDYLLYSKKVDQVVTILYETQKSETDSK